MASLDKDIIIFYNIFLKNFFNKDDKELYDMYKNEVITNYQKKYETFFDSLKVNVFFKNLKRKYIENKKNIVKKIDERFFDSFNDTAKLLYINSYMLLYKNYIKNENTNLYRIRTISFISFLKYFFNDISIFSKLLKDFQFLGKGSFGNIYKSNYGIAVKINKKNTDTSHEEFIGKSVCNKIIDKFHIPNFVYTFGLFESDGKNESIDNEENIKDEKINIKLFLDSKPKSILLIEQIENSTTLSDMLKNNKLNVNEFKEIYYQILMSLYLANEYYAFVHNDLHSDNILVYKNFKSKLFNYPMVYKDFVLEHFPKYVPKIIDYNTGCCIVKGKYFYPDIKYYIIPNINNDIYKLTVTCLIDAKNKNIKKFLHSILTEYFINEKISISQIEKYYEDFLFKKMLTKGDTTILKNILKEFKKENLQMVKYKLTKDVLDTSFYFAYKNDNIHYLLFNLHFLHDIENVLDYIDKNSLEFYLEKIYDLRSYFFRIFYNTSYIRNYFFKKEINTIKPYMINEKVNYSNLNVLDNIMNDNDKEFGRKFNKEGYWKWYTSVSSEEETKKLVYFYLIFFVRKEFKYPIGYIGFERKKYDNNFIVSIYLNRKMMHKRLGPLVYEIGLENFFKEIKEEKYKEIIVSASIFDWNNASINFFKKLDFNYLNKNKNIVVYTRKYNIE